MGRDKTIKTNAMRLLDKARIKYQVSSYMVADGKNDGISVAQKLGVDPSLVFKTLVLTSDKSFHVAIIPSDHSLDLKSTARAFGVKRVELIAVTDLLPLTGYIKGGCSPLAMKKVFPSLIDQTAQALEEIYISAGKIGWQIRVNPGDLADCLSAGFAVLSTKE